MSSIAPTTSNPPPSAPIVWPSAVAAAPDVSQAKVTDTATATPTSNSSQPKTNGSTNKAKPSDEDIKRATEDLQQRVNKLTPELKFSIDKSSGEAVITLTDRNTDEVIRQIPSKEALELTRAMDQYQRGLILNRQA